MLMVRTVGFHGRTRAVLAIPTGLRGKSFHCLSAADAWYSCDLDKLIGVPWNHDLRMFFSLPGEGVRRTSTRGVRTFLD